MFLDEATSKNWKRCPGRGSTIEEFMKNRTYQISYSDRGEIREVTPFGFRCQALRHVHTELELGKKRGEGSKFVFYFTQCSRSHSCHEEKGDFCKIHKNQLDAGKCTKIKGVKNKVFLCMNNFDDEIHGKMKLFYQLLHQHSAENFKMCVFSDFYEVRT